MGLMAAFCYLGRILPVNALEIGKNREVAALGQILASVDITRRYLMHNVVRAQWFHCLTLMFTLAVLASGCAVVTEENAQVDESVVVDEARGALEHAPGETGSWAAPDPTADLLEIHSEHTIPFGGGLSMKSYDIVLGSNCIGATTRSHYESSWTGEGSCAAYRWESSVSTDCRVRVHIGVKPLSKGTCNVKIYQQTASATGE
jgi:hypothetical protein